jgi:hypothetical protein
LSIHTARLVLPLMWCNESVSCVLDELEEMAAVGGYGGLSNATYFVTPGIRALVVCKRSMQQSSPRLTALTKLSNGGIFWHNKRIPRCDPRLLSAEKLTSRLRRSITFDVRF